MTERFVVYWNGDEDCGGRNDGPVAIYRQHQPALDRARREAEDENTKRNGIEPPRPRGDEGYELVDGRCEVLVKRFDDDD